MVTKKGNRRYKKWLIAFCILLLAGASALWYIFTEKFTDTTETKADYTVNAPVFIKEFKTDLKLANKKYAEKIVVVNGIVTEVKQADTVSNIIMSDTTSGAYIIFSFQSQHQAETGQIMKGDDISIKGSCSGGVFSEILETESISFKRCAINK